MAARIVVCLVISLMVSAASAEALSLPDTRAASAEATLESRVSTITRGFDGEIGVAVIRFSDGRTITVNGDHPFETASLYKLLVAYRVYREVQRGELSSDDPLTLIPADMIASDPGDDIEVGTEMSVADALHAMITWSSNAAALSLVRVSGGWDGILEEARGLGIQVQYEDDQFLMRPTDVSVFYERLASGKLLERPYAEELMSLLLEQQKKDRIPAFLPADIAVAHKTGELENVRNDAGIVFGPRAAYVIVVMANDANPDEAVQAEAEISRIVYDALQAN